MPLSLPEIQLNRSALRDLTQLADRIEDCERILAIANKLGPQPGIVRLGMRIGEEAKLPFAVVRDVIRSLLNIYRTKQTFNLDTADFVQTLTRSFEENAKTDDEKAGLKSWKEKKDRVVAIVESLSPDDALPNTEKAGRLTFAHQNVLKEAQILTDVRPVFTEDGSKITQSIIYHTLIIEFFDGEAKRIEFTLDAPDVSALKRFCVRAEQKAITAKEAMKSLPWQTAVFNEWDMEQPPTIGNAK